MTNNEKLQIIHESFTNGQNKQAVEQIDQDFLMYDFWELYLSFLKEIYPCGTMFILKDFSSAVIIYHRIKNR